MSKQEGGYKPENAIPFGIRKLVDLEEDNTKESKGTISAGKPTRTQNPHGSDQDVSAVDVDF